jgi:hypothetical protein
MNPYVVADRSGICKATVERFIDGTTRMPRISTMGAIFAAYGERQTVVAPAEKKARPRSTGRSLTLFGIRMRHRVRVALKLRG